MNKALSNRFQKDGERLPAIYSKWLKERQTQLRGFEKKRWQTQRKLNKYGQLSKLAEKFISIYVYFRLSMTHRIVKLNCR